jgi:hypothetical protein
VLDQLTLDLQSAHFEDDGNTWLAATVQNAPGGIPNWISNDQNPARAKPATALSLNMIAADFSSDANRFGVAGTWLRFYTTARGTNQNTGAAPFAVNASAPVAVSYQIVRRIASTATTTAAARRYLLHRAQVRPALNGTALGTLEAGRNITATAYTRTTPAAGNTGANGDPRTVRAPTLDSVIADNVIDFGVRFYVRDAATVGGLRLVFPANTAGVPANTPLTYLANVPPGGNGSDSFANRACWCAERPAPSKPVDGHLLWDILFCHHGRLAACHHGRRGPVCFGRVAVVSFRAFGMDGTSNAQWTAQEALWGGPVFLCGTSAFNESH